MILIREIESIEDPLLAPYRAMQMQVDHLQRKIFVAEGEKIVRRLLDSDLSVQSVCLPPKWLPDFAPRVEKKSELIPVFVAPKEELEKLTGYSLYQGVLAVGLVPEPIPFDETVDSADRPRFFLALDGLANAENMGAIIRSAVVLGAQALLVDGTSSHPYMRRSVRTSMGNLFRLPVLHLPELRDGLLRLKESGVRIIAAHARAELRPVYEADFRGDCCIVLGGEGNGISEAVLSVCDDAVAVPMEPGVDSLNVGNAAAVFFYELVRQRKQG